MFPRKPWCVLSAAAVCLCGSLPAAAGALDMEAAAAAQPAAAKAGSALAVQIKGWNVLMVPDAEGKVGGLLLKQAQGVPMPSTSIAMVRDLGSDMGLESPQHVSYSGGVAFLAADGTADARHLLGGTPLQGLMFLLDRGYYHINGMNDAGEVGLVSGKKRSIDLRLPMTAAKVDAVELTVSGVNMDTFAANVLADKLGYGADNSTPEEKIALKTELKAKEVYYLQRRRKLALVCIGKRYFFGEKKAISELAAAAPAPALTYPDAAALRLSTEPAAASHPPAKPDTPAPSTAPARPLTPAEAVQAYIKHLNEL